VIRDPHPGPVSAFWHLPSCLKKAALKLPDRKQLTFSYYPPFEMTGSGFHMKPVIVLISVIAPPTLKRILKNYYLHISVYIFKKFSGVKKENAMG
jgi:hypothetical protein